MRKEYIKDKNKVLTLILKGNSFPKGLNFYTQDKDFIQASTWRYDKGKKTIPHAHKIVKRIANRTQEVVYVKKGRMKLSVYSDNDKLISKRVIKAGDIAVNFAGGHAYEILEDGTEILEIKNGPYPGIEKDKKTLNK